MPGTCAKSGSAWEKTKIKAATSRKQLKYFFRKAESL
jgi:hypothetical protein